MSDELLSSSYLEVSRADLADNARAVADYVGVPVIGVVKCDGYGVSSVEAARAWISAGVTTLAVSDPVEALVLRRAGFTQDILVLAPTADPDLLDALLHEEGIILTVSGPDSARRYAQRGGEHPVRVHVAVDTGMGRFGTRWTDTEELLEIYRTEGLSFEGIFSHFAASFAPDKERTMKQLERFLSAVSALEERGIAVGTRHIANSHAALRFPETRLDAVRPGSALLGRLLISVPIPLKRVGAFKASVVDRRTLRKGDTTGYGSICAMKRDTEVAVVALGRYSGFGLAKRPERLRPLDLLRAVKQAISLYRHPPTVRYQGKALRVIGRVGTQYTLVETGGTGIAPGDVVTTDVDVFFPNSHHRYI